MKIRLIVLAFLLGTLSSCSSKAVKVAIKGEAKPTFAIANDPIGVRLSVSKLLDFQRNEKYDGLKSYKKEILWTIMPKRDINIIEALWTLPIKEIRYETVPEEYTQIFPESGEMPKALETGNYYLVIVAPVNGNSDEMVFKVEGTNLVEIPNISQ